MQVVKLSEPEPPQVEVDVNTIFRPAPTLRQQRRDDNIRRIQADLEQVRNIMTTNLDRVIQRGECLESLEDISRLQSDSLQFRSYRRAPSILDTLSSIGQSISNTFSGLFSPRDEGSALILPDIDEPPNFTSIRKNDKLINQSLSSFGADTRLPQSQVIDSLESFILLQRANGSFPLTIDLESHLNKSHDEILGSIPDEIKSNNRLDDQLKEVIWSTILAMVNLEKTFGSRKSEWQMLWNKAQKFITKQNLSTSLDFLKIKAESFLAIK